LRSGADPKAAVTAALAGRNEASTWQPTLYRLAVAQYAAGDAPGGRRSLDEYLESVRREGRLSEAEIQTNLGLFFYEVRDYRQAEKHLRDAVTRDPESAYSAWALGYVLIEKPGALAEGRTLVERGLQRAPNDARLLDAKGWALYRQDRAAEGYSWLRRAQLASGTTYDPRIVEHLDAVAAELKDPARPPAPRTRWL
jgi:Tfp pilus assembly protein PilF